MNENSLRRPKKNEATVVARLDSTSTWSNESQNSYSKRDQLVGMHLSFAKMIARKVAKGLSKDADVDEMISNANLGLLKAAACFDPTFEVGFEKYAYHRIRGAIYDGLRKTLWLPHNFYSKIMEKRRHIEENLRDEKIKTRSNTPEETQLPFHIFYVDSQDRSFEFEDKGAIDIEQLTALKRIRDHLLKFVEELPKQHREIVNQHYYEGKTFEEVGQSLGLSKSWVSRLHTKILQVLYNKMNRLNPNLPIKISALSLQ